MKLEELTQRRFKCEVCGVEVVCEDGGKAALAELEHNFPAVPIERCIRVCSECYLDAIAEMLPTVGRMQ
jgi:hypothetical protein